MVRKVFSCSICGYVYADEKLAESCEEYCSTHKSCSMQIVKQAIGTLNNI